MKRVAIVLVLVSSCYMVSITPAMGDYLAGNAAYLEGNYAKALKEYMDDHNPASLYHVGYMYAHGEGVQLDPVEAANWYRKSAEKGYAPALYRMGEIYENGFGVEQDTKEAQKWYKKAADKGFAPAKEALKRYKIK
jgi:hypothetical protein